MTNTAKIYVPIIAADFT